MNIKMVIGIILLIVIGIFVSFQEYPVNDSRSPQTVATTSPSQSIDEYVGVISTGASGQNVYTNNKYGFRFTYPQGWRVGNNILGMPYGGTLQLFNYADTEHGASSKGFTKGENKIEAAIVPSSAPSPYSSSEYPASIKTTQLVVAGEIAVRTDVELIVGGEKSRSYLLPLKNMSGQSLRITIGGDSSNFYVLDDLVKSIIWK